jgi:hypothetical protein
MSERETMSSSSHLGNIILAVPASNSLRKSPQERDMEEEHAILSRKSAFTIYACSASRLLLMWRESCKTRED